MRNNKKQFSSKALTVIRVYICVAVGKDDNVIRLTSAPGKIFTKRFIYNG